jgi:hypothetical protein
MSTEETLDYSIMHLFVTFPSPEIFSSLAWNSIRLV